jgi:hypothetical protein
MVIGVQRQAVFGLHELRSSRHRDHRNRGIVITETAAS